MKKGCVLFLLLSGAVFAALTAAWAFALRPAGGEPPWEKGAWLGLLGLGTVLSLRGLLKERTEIRLIEEAASGTPPADGRRAAAIGELHPTTDAGLTAPFSAQPALVASYVVQRTARVSPKHGKRRTTAVKAFEGSGVNSLHAFLASAREEGGEEWDIVAPPGIDAVRVMTVHKAKGLGFPAVVLLLHGQRYKADPWAVVRGEAGIELVRVNEHLAKLDPWLRQVQDAEKDRYWVERLNTLYVALTRAKREMYVIGARGATDSFPFDLLPLEEFPPGGDREPPPAEPRHDETTTPIAHEAAPPRIAERREELSHAQRRRGRFIHLVLSLLATTDDLEAALAAAATRAMRQMRAPDAEGLPDLAAALRQLGLDAWFSPRPGRTVCTERDFCDERGRVHRMDRLVVDPDRVLVLDWKTGSEEIGTPEQEAQVRAYAAILRQVYPGRAVEALLVHLDRRETRSVV